MYRKSSILLLVLMLQGCAVGLLAAGVGSVAVTETTGKTITDHAVSTVNDKDCKVSRIFKDEKVCQDEPKASVTVVSAPSNAIATQEDIFSKRKQLAKANANN